MIIASEIAQELLERIQADATFNTWTKLRSYRPVAKLEDLAPGFNGAHRLTIVPRGVAAERLTRTELSLETTIDLAIQDLIRLNGSAGGATELGDFDGVLEAVEQLMAFVQSMTNSVLFEGNENESHFDSADVTLMEVRDVDETRVATAVITARFISTWERT